MKKSALLLLTFVILISCSKDDSNEPITTNSTIIQSVKINVPIGAIGFPTTFSEFDFSPLNQHISNTNDIQNIVVNSVSYRFKNLNRIDTILIDSYSISFNALEIENVTSQTDLLQAINQGTIIQIENQELFEDLAQSILINPSVSVSSFGILQWDGMNNDFEIEVTINVDVTTAF